MKLFVYVLTVLIQQQVAHRQYSYINNSSNEHYYQSQSQRLPLNSLYSQEQSIGQIANSSELLSDATQRRQSNTNSNVLQNAMQQPRPILDSDVAPLPNPPIISSTTQFPFTSTAPPAFSRCIQACGVTSEYSPVCGTNRFTYYNMSRLRCAQYCGLVVELSNIGRCP